MRDNASQRILSPRRDTAGRDDSLRNTYGRTLLDGSQCYVTDEEANYRFLKHSVLHADGKFVVETVDHQGRWVREQGLTGFALLDEGLLHEGCFRDYKKSQLVQFAVNGDGRIIYTGAVPRKAFLVGRATPSAGAALVVVLSREKEVLWTAQGTDAEVSTVLIVRPGDAVTLNVAAVPTGNVFGALEIVLG